MMSGVPLETCRAFNKRWNNKFYYKVAFCWLFLLIHTAMHGSMNIKKSLFLILSHKFQFAICHSIGLAPIYNYIFQVVSFLLVLVSQVYIHLYSRCTLLCFMILIKNVEGHKLYISVLNFHTGCLLWTAVDGHVKLPILSRLN
jgi:hypothetical protein